MVTTCSRTMSTGGDPSDVAIGDGVLLRERRPRESRRAPRAALETPTAWAHIFRERNDVLSFHLARAEAQTSSYLTHIALRPHENPNIRYLR